MHPKYWGKRPAVLYNITNLLICQYFCGNFDKKPEKSRDLSPLFCGLAKILANIEKYFAKPIDRM